MKEFTYTIKILVGSMQDLQGELVKAAASISMQKQPSGNGKEVDAKRILGVIWDLV